MTLAIPTIISSIKRHLSVIGKRLYNKNGKNMFSDITLSTAEDTALLTQYIYAASENIEAMLRPLVTSFMHGGGNVVIVLKNTRSSLDYESRTENMVMTYITLYAVCEYLAMVHPELAAKYQTDATNAMQALVAYVYWKLPPEASDADYKDI